MATILDSRHACKRLSECLDGKTLFTELCVSAPIDAIIERFTEFVVHKEGNFIENVKHWTNNVSPVAHIRSDVLRPIAAGKVSKSTKDRVISWAKTILSYIDDSIDLVPLSEVLQALIVVG